MTSGSASMPPCSTSVFAAAARTAGDTAAQHGPPFLLDNAQRVLLMLHVRGDNNPRHNIPGAPQLDPITGALFVVGLLLVLRGSGLDAPRRVGVLAFWLLPLVPSAVSDPPEVQPASTARSPHPRNPHCVQRPVQAVYTLSGPANRACGSAAFSKARGYGSARAGAGR